MDHDDYSATKGANSASKHPQYGNHIKLFCTVRMLHDITSGTDMRIDGCDFTDVVLVAKVISTDANAHRVKALVADSSGIIEVQRALPKQVDSSDWQGNYFRFFLHPTYSSTQWTLHCNSMIPLQSYNEVAMHMGNVMEGHLRRTKGPKKSK